MPRIPESVGAFPYHYPHVKTYTCYMNYEYVQTNIKVWSFCVILKVDRWINDLTVQVIATVRVSPIINETHEMTGESNHHVGVQSEMTSSARIQTRNLSVHLTDAICATSGELREDHLWEATWCNTFGQHFNTTN